MAKKLNLKAHINGLTISTVYNKFEKVYETLVTDDVSGDELAIYKEHYKNDAKSKHMVCIAHFVDPRNRIHLA